jgi:hypothetical protein
MAAALQTLPTVLHDTEGLRPPPHTIDPQAIEPHTIPVGVDVVSTPDGSLREKSAFSAYRTDGEPLACKYGRIIVKYLLLDFAP